MIAERPRLGRLRPDIDEQVRSFVHKAHIIYYEPHVNGVLILRVLHGAQDPVRHFPDMPERG